mmetsp:Transcript_57874/g.156115  ORF Transcript_57874/g.156115 Transcript_57874/m.156115 type:complete len:130 (-) Transcript_57874:109-498(-)
MFGVLRERRRRVPCARVHHGRGPVPPPEEEGTFLRAGRGARLRPDRGGAQAPARQRPFFRLAVRQAEAAYDIKATHPLFVYFVADPDAEMATFAEQGTKWFLLGMLVHFGWQCLAVGLAARGFAKLGHF